MQRSRVDTKHIFFDGRQFRARVHTHRLFVELSATEKENSKEKKQILQLWDDNSIIRDTYTDTQTIDRKGI